MFCDIVWLNYKKMSEVKRAKLISFEANRVDSANFGRTVRISVILPESTEGNCPEYNYKDELVAAKVSL